MNDKTLGSVLKSTPRFLGLIEQIGHEETFKAIQKKCWSGIYIAVISHGVWSELICPHCLASLQHFSVTA
jgi:hypothetical protein